jgi:hypothetical protein
MIELPLLTRRIRRRQRLQTAPRRDEESKTSAKSLVQAAFASHEPSAVGLPRRRV